MAERSRVSTSSTARPETPAARASMRSPASHWARLIISMRWISSLASMSRPMRSTAVRSTPPRSRYWVEVYTAGPWARPLPNASPNTRAVVSSAVRPSLSVTPGRNPTSSNQSKSLAKGVREATCSTGSCRAASARSLRTPDSSTPATV